MRYLLTLTLVLSCFVPLAGGADAAEIDPTPSQRALVEAYLTAWRAGQLDAFMANQSLSDRAYLVQLSQITRVETKIGIGRAHRAAVAGKVGLASVSAASGCNNLAWSIEYYNNGGYLVFKYSHQPNWCTDGTTITSAAPYDWADIYWPGHSYLGNEVFQQTGGVGQTTWYWLSGGGFCSWIGDWCYAQRHPRIGTTQRGDLTAATNVMDPG